MAKAYGEHLRSKEGPGNHLRGNPRRIRCLRVEKNRRATPHIAEARALKSAASKAKVPIDLLKIPTIRSGLLTAAGVSDKAAGYLQESDREEAIAGLIGKYLEPAGASFVEELVFRFLLSARRHVGRIYAKRRRIHGSVQANAFTNRAPESERDEVPLDAIQFESLGRRARKRHRH